MALAQQRKGPGRPTGQGPTNVRRKLLNAARDSFIDSGFDGVSSKEIAARAGVNPAMINYYFKNKEGLSRTMMLDAMSPLLEKISAAEESKTQLTLTGFLRGYMGTLAANPWLPKLVVREVLPDNGRLRGVFLTELAERAAKLLPEIINREQQSKDLRTDLDPGLLMISVISLAVFPFLAAPLLEPVLDVSLTDTLLIDRLIEHTLDVLQRGIAAEKPA